MKTLIKISFLLFILFINNLYGVEITKWSSFGISVYHYLGVYEADNYKSQSYPVTGMDVGFYVFKDKYLLDLSAFFASNMPPAMDRWYNHEGVFKEYYLTHVNIGLSRIYDFSFLKLNNNEFGCGVFIANKKHWKTVTIMEEIEPDNIQQVNYLRNENNWITSGVILSYTYQFHHIFNCRNLGIKFKYSPDLLLWKNMKFKVSHNLCLLFVVTKRK